MHAIQKQALHRECNLSAILFVRSQTPAKLSFQATEKFSRNLSYPTSIMNLEIWHQVPLYCTLSSRETSVSWIFLEQRWTNTLNYWINNSSIPRSLRGASLRVKMSHPSSLLASPRCVTCEGPSKSPQGFEFIQSGLEIAFSWHMKWSCTCSVKNRSRFEKEKSSYVQFWRSSCGLPRYTRTLE